MSTTTPKLRNVPSQLQALRQKQSIAGHPGLNALSLPTYRRQCGPSIDGHLWSFPAAGGIRPVVYGGSCRLANMVLSLPDAFGVWQGEERIGPLPREPVLKHGPGTACGGKGP